MSPFLSSSIATLVLIVIAIVVVRRSQVAPFVALLGAAIWVTSIIFDEVWPVGRDHIFNALNVGCSAYVLGTSGLIYAILIAAGKQKRLLISILVPSVIVAILLIYWQIYLVGSPPTEVGVYPDVAPRQLVYSVIVYGYLTLVSVIVVVSHQPLLLRETCPATRVGLRIVLLHHLSVAVTLGLLCGQATLALAGSIYTFEQLGPLFSISISITFATLLLAPLTRKQSAPILGVLAYPLYVFDALRLWRWQRWIVEQGDAPLHSKIPTLGEVLRTPRHVRTAAVIHISDARSRFTGNLAHLVPILEKEDFNTIIYHLTRTPLPDAGATSTQPIVTP